jgi:hypothetical protein
MLNFSEELRNYQPMLTMGDVESALYNDELKDIIEVLSKISEQMVKPFEQ